MRRTELMTTPEAAQHLRLSRRTLERYRVTGEGPKFFKLGRLVFYRETTLNAWRDERERRSTSDPGPDSTTTRAKRPHRKRRGAINDPETTHRDASKDVNPPPE